jgi:hypothetical protein
MLAMLFCVSSVTSTVLHCVLLAMLFCVPSVTSTVLHCVLLVKVSPFVLIYIPILAAFTSLQPLYKQESHTKWRPLLSGRFRDRQSCYSQDWQDFPARILRIRNTTQTFPLKAFLMGRQQYLTFPDQVGLSRHLGTRSSLWVLGVISTVDICLNTDFEAVTKE